MKKGLKTLIAGIIFLVLGVIAVPAYIVLFVALDENDDQQFIIPGTTEVSVEEPGRHYLWHDHRAVFNGKTYNKPEDLPDGIEIAIIDANGNHLEFHSDTSISSSSGDNSSKSIGFIEADQIGKLTITISGTSEERLFSFSRHHTAKVVGAIFGVFGLSLALVLIGIGALIWGIVKLANHRKKSP